MEVGRIAQMEQAQANNAIEIQKVQETSDSNIIKFDDEHQESRKQTLQDYNEVVLDNVRFGYNKKSQDFFIKIQRGELEIKYPTEEMMKRREKLLQMLREMDARL
jgi:uncharacterized FlaG/YvyC family protein